MSWVQVELTALLLVQFHFTLLLLPSLTHLLSSPLPPLIPSIHPPSHCLFPSNSTSYTSSQADVTRDRVITPAAKNGPSVALWCWNEWLKSRREDRGRDWGGVLLCERQKRRSDWECLKDRVRVSQRQREFGQGCICSTLQPLIWLPRFLSNSLITIAKSWNMTWF